MIRIMYDPEELILKLSGHAGSAPKGQDLVCAAVSALFGALQLSEDIAVAKNDDGSFTAVNICAGGMNAFRLIAHTLEQLSRQYPEYISYETGDPSRG